MNKQTSEIKVKKSSWLGMKSEIALCHKKIEHLEKALIDMPAIDIAFRSRKEMDGWNKWKSKYFNSEGQIK